VFSVDLLIGQGPRHVAPGDAEHLRGAACGQDLGATGDGFFDVKSWMKLGFSQEKWMKLGFSQKL